jgi:hypothetical protein
MINIFKDLNAIIDRWISLKMKYVIDEREIVENYLRLSNLLKNKQFNVGVWANSRKGIYQHYKLGEFGKAQKNFYESIRRSIYAAFETSIEVDLKELTGRRFYKPHTIDIQKLLTNEELKSIEQDALKSIKEYILINEAARKLKLKYVDDSNEWVQRMKDLAKIDSGINLHNLIMPEKDETVSLSIQGESIQIPTINDVKSIVEQNSVQIKGENIFCKGMDMTIVENHFIVLLQYVSSNNNKPFLTPEQYREFINSAFLGKKLKKKIRINKAIRGEKQLIISLFYDFYNDTCEDYFQTTNCRDKYIELLSKYFVDFEFESLKHNFKPKTRKTIQNLKKYEV